MISGSAAYLAYYDAFALNSHIVQALAGRYAETFEQAQDYASEAWTRAYTAWESFDGGNLLGWMHTIVRNVARGQARRKRPKQISLDLVAEDRPLPHEVVERLSEQTDFDFILEHLEQDGPLCRAYRKLPEQDQEAIRLKIECDCDADAAATLGISDVAYRQRLFRARQRIRALLEEE